MGKFSVTTLAVIAVMVAVVAVLTFAVQIPIPATRCPNCTSQL